MILGALNENDCLIRYQMDRFLMFLFIVGVIWIQMIMCKDMQPPNGPSF